MMKKNINEEIYEQYFFNQIPLFLAKELYINQNINYEIVKHINDALIELKKDINIKKLLKMKIQIKIVDIVKKNPGL